MRLIFAIFALIGSMAAQSFDNEGGWIQGPAGPGHPHKVNATCSQSGTTQTVVVPNGTLFLNTEPMMVQGSGTGMDWAWANTVTAGASVITNIAGNTLTLTSPNSLTQSAVSCTIKPARFYLATTTWRGRTGPRLFTFEDHWNYFLAVGQANTATNFTAKYGSVCAGAQGNMQELQNWGYTGITVDSDAHFEPDGFGTCGTNTRLPQGAGTLNLVQYASANLNNLISQPVINFELGLDSHYSCSGVKTAMIDFFDPRFASFANAYAPGSLGIYYKSPWNVFFVVDDSDNFDFPNAGPYFHTVSKNHNTCDPAMVILKASPLMVGQNHRIYGGGAALPYMMPDPKVYSRDCAAYNPYGNSATPSVPTSCTVTTPCSLCDYLTKEYGTIGALNTAWGTSGFYTTFGSSGTANTSVSVGTGDGTTTTFALALGANLTPNSVQLYVTSTYEGFDCPQFETGCSGGAGTGVLLGSGISSGSVTYSTGAGTVTFSSAPANGAAITANYITCGWGCGTGVMDEDGRNTTWVGSNDMCPLNLPAWQSTHAYNKNDEIEDSTSGTWQIVLVAGTSGSSLPTFNTTQGNESVTDGGVRWHSFGKPVCSSIAGSDYVISKNVNQTLAADVDAWIADYAAEIFSIMRTMTNTYAPDMLYAGTNNLGVWMAPPRKEAMQGAAPYVDISFSEFNGTPAIDPDSDVKLSFYTQYYSGAIMRGLLESSSQSPFPCDVGPTFPGCYTTQQALGQAWYDQVNDALTSISYNGTYQVIGNEQWGLHPLQGHGYGMKDTLDNAYDSNEDVVASVTCSPPLAAFTCGGETIGASWIGANSLTCARCIVNGNSLWYTLTALGTGIGANIGIGSAVGIK